MSECHPVSGNNSFRINNIVRGENYAVSLSLRNDFGRSGQTTSELYGESKTISGHTRVYGVCI